MAIQDRTPSKVILSALALGARVPGIRNFFKAASKLLTLGRLKKLSDVGNSQQLANAVKKFTKQEVTLYNKHLVPLGFPKLVLEGKIGQRGSKITGFAQKETTRTVHRGVTIADAEMRRMGVTKEKVMRTIDQHIDFLKSESFFQKAHKQAKQQGIIERTELSREWFHDYALEQGLNYRSMEMLRTGGKRISDMRLGRMYFFRYRPNKPEEIYDEFPLMFLLAEDPDNMWGLNFHHLSPKRRAILLGKMLDFMNNTEYNENTRLMARKFRSMIQTNKRFRDAKAIYRQYRIEDIKSKVIHVHPLDWELAIMVPTERFKTLGGGRTASKKIWYKTFRRAKTL